MWLAGSCWGLDLVVGLSSQGQSCLVSTSLGDILRLPVSPSYMPAFYEVMLAFLASRHELYQVRGAVQFFIRVALSLRSFSDIVKGCWCLMVSFQFSYNCLIIVAGILLPDPFPEYLCFFVEWVRLLNTLIALPQPWRHLWRRVCWCYELYSSSVLLQERLSIALLFSERSWRGISELPQPFLIFYRISFGYFTEFADTLSQPLDLLQPLLPDILGCSGLRLCFPNTLL